MSSCVTSAFETAQATYHSAILDILSLETEIKIKVANPEAVRRRLRYLGYRVHARRIFESNTVLDTTDLRLRNGGEVLRLRRAGHKNTVTYKGPSRPGRHKCREEVETTVASGDALERILKHLGCEESFRYEKYRTEYARDSERGIVTVDETPVGNYLEIEGSPNWIDETARELGFSPADYITKSYSALYLEYCHERGITPSNMVFSKRTGERLTTRTK